MGQKTSKISHSLMPVTENTYNEIYKSLRNVGYEEVVVDENGGIDLRGVILIKEQKGTSCVNINFVEKLDPDEIALTMVEDLSIIDESEYWQKQPMTRRKAAKQVQLSKVIAELKAYLIRSSDAGK